VKYLSVAATMPNANGSDKYLHMGMYPTLNTEDNFVVTPKGVHLLIMGTINDLLILNSNLMAKH
jgi:hypothetical protein